MDKFDAVKMVHERVMKFEPEGVTRKIIGYMYLQDYPDQEIIRLAMGPETLILHLIQNAKSALKLTSSSTLSIPSSSSFPSPSSFRAPAPLWDTDQQLIYPSDFSHDDPEPSFGMRGRRSSVGVVDFPPKVCHYFNKGFCKHGSNCRYLHLSPFHDNYLFGSGQFDSVNGDQVVSPGSFERLEQEIIELLKSRKGSPVSIASLPMMYYEKYGRMLQADGYLTESQRHGKTGYNLSKLLARLKNSIRLIDRPHGQHCVILADDAPKYGEPGPIVSGSRQIYLTFPSESTFTEEDVSNYFSAFGPVQDVRIPCQQKRMFGFVTFASSDSVKMVLHKGNPHFVCGARVLVKPYREKSKLVERKFQDKSEPSMYYSPHSDFDSEIQSRLDSKFLRRLEENALELDTRQLSQLQLARKPPPPGHSYFGYSLDDDFFQLDGLHGGGSSSSDDNQTRSGKTCHDHDSNQGISLPDSPFASALQSSISAVM